MIIVLQKVKIKRRGIFGRGPVVDGKTIGEPIMVEARQSVQVVNRAVVQIRKLIDQKQSFTVEILD